MGLTKRTIKATQPDPNTDVWLWDDEVRGFYCRIKPTGKKTFGYQYRRGGDTRRIKIGDFPAWTVDDARDTAKDYRYEVDKGGDPGHRVREARRQSAGKTLESAAKEFVNGRYMQDGKLTVHGTEVQRQFIKLVNPSFGDYAIADIKRSDIKGLIEKIAKKNGPSMAKHVLKRLRTFFKWAMGEELIAIDPTYAIPTPQGEKIGTRVLEDWELALVGQAIDRLPQPRQDFFKLVLLCGQRRKETSALRVSEIDRPNKVWKFGKSKNGAYQEVPFGAAAWAIVEPMINAAESAKRDYLFVSEGQSDKHIQNYSGMLDELNTAISKLHPEPLGSWSYHDLRRTMRTVMPKLGVSKDVAELCLCHSKKGMEAVYDHHSYRDEKRAAFKAWTGYLDRLVNPPADNVVQMRA